MFEASKETTSKLAKALFHIPYLHRTVYKLIIGYDSPGGTCRSSW